MHDYQKIKSSLSKKVHMQLLLELWHEVARSYIVVQEMNSLIYSLDKLITIQPAKVFRTPG